MKSKFGDHNVLQKKKFVSERKIMNVLKNFKNLSRNIAIVTL